MLGERLLERGLVPDRLVRAKIRSLLKDRLEREKGGNEEDFVRSLRDQPIAVSTREANDQHYEVPARFFELVLGSNLKYSCGYYEAGARSLDEAEEAMLALTARRAGLADGQRILELGCGWGSLTLWMAKRYPRARITAVSNSHGQREFVEAKALREGLANVEVVTCDMNSFRAAGLYDRIVSVEMFEHMRNVPELLRRIEGFLEDDGKLFVHVFVHARHSYLFEDNDESDWMARHFFSGGMMPSRSLYRRFQENLVLASQWDVDGRNYQRTAEDWLKNVDRRREEVLEVFANTYGAKHALRWLARWRVFFMACAELWGFAGGGEWMVSHYLFAKPKTS